MLSVSALNEQAKNLLEAHFSYVEVVGEVSRLTKHNSGHWYFTLKDENASVSAVMYKMNNTRIKFDVKDGMKVVICGKVSLYSPSGSYQLIANSMRPDGLGELELAFNQLKERLSLEGLFDIQFKKQIPQFPRKIGLITSTTSAALQDMLKVLNSRWKMSEIYVYDALTQGENAPNSLIRALKKADTHELDVIVLARGGGSREDLWCFNDESLAREIFNAKTPVISAIGHEIDYVISDFVADRRSPTPSAAILDLVPDESVMLQYLDAKQTELFRALNLKITNAQNRLNLIRSKLNVNTILARIDTKFALLNSLKFKLSQAGLNKISNLNTTLSTLRALLNAREGFFETTKDMVELRVGTKKIALEKLKSGDEIEIISQKTSKKAKII